MIPKKDDEISVKHVLNEPVHPFVCDAKTLKIQTHQSKKSEQAPNPFGFASNIIKIHVLYDVFPIIYTTLYWTPTASIAFSSQLGFPCP